MNATLLRTPRRRSGISLTALIDCVFILLLFFMLSSSFSQWRAVNLQAPLASSTPVAEQPQMLLLGADASLQLRGGEFRANDYRTLDGLNGLDAQRAVVLVPAADANLQDIVGALEKLQALGLVKLVLGNVQQD